MGKISKKNKNNIEPSVWDSLHDLELMLVSFEKYGFENILEKNRLQKLYTDKNNEVTDGKEKYVKKVRNNKGFNRNIYRRKNITDALPRCVRNVFI